MVTQQEWYTKIYQSWAQSVWMEEKKRQQRPRKRWIDGVKRNREKRGGGETQLLVAAKLAGNIRGLKAFIQQECHQWTDRWEYKEKVLEHHFPLKAGLSRNSFKLCGGN